MLASNGFLSNIMKGLKVEQLSSFDEELSFIFLLSFSTSNIADLK